jgi:hypothetical protein
MLQGVRGISRWQSVCKTVQTVCVWNWKKNMPVHLWWHFFNYGCAWRKMWTTLLSINKLLKKKPKASKIVHVCLLQDLKYATMWPFNGENPNHDRNARIKGKQTDTEVDLPRHPFCYFSDLNYTSWGSNKSRAAGILVVVYGHLGQC